MEDARKVIVIRKAKLTTSADDAALKNEVIEMARRHLLDLLLLIVDHHEEISVNVECGNRTTIFRIDCSQRNLGKVLGSKGRMIMSLRNVVLAITARHGFRSIIEVPYFEHAEETCKTRAAG